MIKKISGIELALRILFRSHSKLPRMVQLAINSDCNMSCEMCPRGYIETTYPYIPIQKAKEIIDRLSGVERIALTGIGEPLLHPDLFEIIKYCKMRGLTTQITTNGTLLDNEINQKVIDSGLDNIAFSLESLKHDTVHGHETRTVVRNIEKFIKFRKENNSNKPIISLQVVLLSEIVEELPGIVEWAARIGIDSISISRATLILNQEIVRPSRTEEKEIFKQIKQLRKKYKIRIDCIQDQQYSGMTAWFYRLVIPFARLEGWCMKWSYFTYVLDNGNIVPCGGFYPRDKTYGNIFNMSLKEIWNGDKYSALRKSKAQWYPCVYCDSLRINHRNKDAI